MCPSIRKKRVSEELALKIRPLSSIPIPFYFYPPLFLSLSFFRLLSFHLFSFIYMYIFFVSLLYLDGITRTSAQHPISRRNEN